MVLEGIINPLKAEKRPWEMFFIGLLYSSAAMLVSLIFFIQYASLIMVFFTVSVSIPIIYWTIKEEEGKDLSIHNEKLLIKEHGKALTFFIFLFAGFVVSFTLWYTFLPADISSTAFKVQSNTIAEVNNPLTGNAFNLASTLTFIFLNNVKVLLFCLIFAFFYGFGAIFILTWNASVMAVAIGNLIHSTIGPYATVVPLALLKYFVHGIPEMFAYFMAGLAGGIISVAVIRHDFSSNQFKHIIMDSADLIAGSVVMLLVAALLEVFVSPLIL